MHNIFNWFFYRFYNAPNKLKFLKWGWIDFISSIPFIDFLRFGRLLRLLRLLRILRAFKSVKHIAEHVYKDKGNYTAQLSVTNNYDDGKPPQTRPKDVSISAVDQNNDSNEKFNLLKITVRYILNNFVIIIEHWCLILLYIFSPGVKW